VGAAFVASADNTYSVTVAQDIDNVFGVGGLAGASGSEVANHNDRYVEFSLPENTAFKKEVAHGYPSPIEFAQWKQHNVLVYFAAFHFEGVLSIFRD